MQFEDIRKKRQKTKKPFALLMLLLWFWIKKNKWKVIIFILLCLILLNPVGSGKVIGTWITDFVGNLLKSINI
jgi:hypothetical protein